MDDLLDTDEARIYLELRKAADMAELKEDFDKFYEAEMACADYAYRHEDQIFKQTRKDYLKDELECLFKT